MAGKSIRTIGTTDYVFDFLIVGAAEDDLIEYVVVDVFAVHI